MTGVDVEHPSGREARRGRWGRDVGRKKVHHRGDARGERGVVAGGDRRGVQEIAVVEGMVVELVRAERGRQPDDAAGRRVVDEALARTPRAALRIGPAEQGVVELGSCRLLRRAVADPAGEHEQIGEAVEGLAAEVAVGWYGRGRFQVLVQLGRHLRLVLGGEGGEVECGVRPYLGRGPGQCGPGTRFEGSVDRRVVAQRAMGWRDEPRLLVRHRRDHVLARRAVAQFCRHGGRSDRVRAGDAGDRRDVRPERHRVDVSGRGEQGDGLTGLEPERRARDRSPGDQAVPGATDRRGPHAARPGERHSQPHGAAAQCGVADRRRSLGDQHAAERCAGRGLLHDRHGCSVVGTDLARRRPVVETDRGRELPGDGVGGGRDRRNSHGEPGTGQRERQRQRKDRLRRGPEHQS